MLIRKIFFDANIFNDIFDDKRTNHQVSKNTLAWALQNGIEVYTSCDIVTNIYYITSKYTSSANALNALELIKNTVEIIPFTKNELGDTIELMRKDSDYKDMEDTIQYILAKNLKCDLIISNDKKFISKEIEIFSSQTFIERIATQNFPNFNQKKLF